uniref:Uncharacterized protein n=1 Tax=Panagrolaimus sp. JU765 TaxID=591449 RepID=A0AC34R7U1_9BILA
MSNHEKVETTQQSIAILDAAINSILEDDQNSKNVASAVDKLHAHSPGVNTAIERLSPVKTAREGRSPRAIDAKKQPTSSVRTAKSPIVQIQTGRSRSPVATAKDSSNSTRSALSPSNKSKRAQPKNGKQPTTVRTDRSIPSDRSRSTKTGLSVTPTKSYIKLSRSDVKAALGKKKGVTGLSKLLRDVSDVNTGREKSGSSTNSDASSTTKKKLTPAEQWKHVQSGPGPKIVPKEAASSDASLKTAHTSETNLHTAREKSSRKPFQTQEPFRTGRSPSYGTERSPDPATAKSPIVSATKFELFVVILYGLIYLLFTISLFIALLARHVLIWLLSSSQYGKKDPVGDGPAKTAIKAFLNSVKGFAQAANFDAYDESNAKNIFLSVEEKPDLKSKKLKYWLVPFPAIFGFDSGRLTQS